jgi:UDP-N-acetylmuramate--alanine ligase
LLVMFQPHGYGPLKLMRGAFIEAFAEQLAPEDVLLITEPVYFGGTVDREVGAAEIAGGVTAAGRKAQAVPDRAAARARLLELASAGDRVGIMGARDDTLSQFARELLALFGARR